MAVYHWLILLNCNAYLIVLTNKNLRDESNSVKEYQQKIQTKTIE